MGLPSLCSACQLRWFVCFAILPVWLVRLVDRVSVLCPTLAGVCFRCACLGSSTGLLARTLRHNGEWGRRQDTQSTSQGGVSGFRRTDILLTSLGFGIRGPYLGVVKAGGGVCGRRLHSPLPQSVRANHPVDGPILAHQWRSTASVSRRTRTTPTDLREVRLLKGVRRPQRQARSTPTDCG
jgi:hypothetical protein